VTSGTEADAQSSNSDVARHASLEGVPDLAWVVVAHWRFDDHEEWFTEYWSDDFNEEAPEVQHRSWSDAVAHAEAEFGPLEWKPGPPPR
jgi:hypothetical protein